MMAQPLHFEHEGLVSDPQHPFQKSGMELQVSVTSATLGGIDRQVYGIYLPESRVNCRTPGLMRNLDSKGKVLINWERHPMLTPASMSMWVCILEGICTSYNPSQHVPPPHTFTNNKNSSIVLIISNIKPNSRLNNAASCHSASWSLFYFSFFFHLSSHPNPNPVTLYTTISFHTTGLLLLGGLPEMKFIPD